MGELQINAVVNSPTVSTLAVTVTAADLSDPFVFNFELVNGTVTGQIIVPAGGRRTITVRAYDVSDGDRCGRDGGGGHGGRGVGERRAGGGDGRGGARDG